MQKGSIHSEYRRELKKRILDCAVDKFFTLGIRAVKMDDIAKALGISKRTLYEIYSDKEQLLVDSNGNTELLASRVVWLKRRRIAITLLSFSWHSIIYTWLKCRNSIQLCIWTLRNTQRQRTFWRSMQGRVTAWLWSSSNVV